MSKIKAISLHAIGPTQLTVGLIEVAEKTTRFEGMKPKDRQAYLEAHPMPGVLGPGNKVYITDHHHLGRAALEARLEGAFYFVQEDFSTLSCGEFWSRMEANAWVHPLDQNGVRHSYAAIPSHLPGLVDDVYRSLAGYVRNAGGYQKTTDAFAEFIWADFFRRTIAFEDLKSAFLGTVPRAIELAHSHHAKGLPGYLRK
jgi:hypothetical protein